MAKVTTRVDDLDGRTKLTDADPVTVLSLDGRTVELDLSDKHRKELADVLAQYLDAGSEVASAGRKSHTPQVSPYLTGDAAQATTDEIRVWAADNGHKVADRGRLPRPVLEAFNAAFHEGKV